MPDTDYVRDEIEESFDRIDEDGDRSIRFEEFMTIMLELDHTRPASALRINFDAIDSNRDGRVSFEEFRAWMSR
jgi:Ca2+-binding EF-hand superfamily protein